MNNNYRSKLSYYKQTYNFTYLIAKFADRSWLEDLPLPAKIAQDPKSILAFQSNLLLAPLPELDKQSLLEDNILLLIASLPKLKLKQFLIYLSLCFLKNDRSLLINGAKLKALAEIFSAEEMDFLLHEKQVKLNLNEKLTISNNNELTQNFLTEMNFYILKSIYSKKDNALFERLKYRFPKNLIYNPKYSFTFSLDLDTSVACTRIIAQVIFPELYSVFEAENKLAPENIENHSAHKNSALNNENAYKIPSIQSNL